MEWKSAPEGLSLLPKAWSNLKMTHYHQGYISDNNYKEFLKHDTLQAEYLNHSRNFVPQVRKDFEKIMDSKKDYWTWQRSRQVIISKVERKPNNKQAQEYYHATFG